MFLADTIGIDYLVEFFLLAAVAGASRDIGKLVFTELVLSGMEFGKILISGSVGNCNASFMGGDLKLLGRLSLFERLY